MPIPTDTFWNIKRLNIWFAISAVLLVLVTIWSIVQDYNRDWRIPQRNAKVWEAALVGDKLQRDLSDEKKKQIENLEKTVAEKQKQLDHTPRYTQLKTTIKKLESDQLNMEFALN